MADDPDKRLRRHETEAERWDRNYSELVQELRVVQTGVQVLFGFLLTLPFQSGFRGLDAAQRHWYVATLAAAAASAAFLIAPASLHRRVFRLGYKPQLVRTASVLAQIGLGALLVAIVGALYLVLSVVVGGWATVIAVALAGLYVALWYLLPLAIRLRGPMAVTRRSGAARSPLRRRPPA